jgi:phosphatidylglycerophosphate synthase
MLKALPRNAVRFALNIPNVMTAARVVLSGFILFFLLRNEFLIGGVFRTSSHEKRS